MQEAGPAPRVSVIMATFNGAPTIGRAVASVLAQTMADFELIVAIDGSTDTTREVLAGMADTRLRIIDSTVNRGVVPSRNACFDAARGQYVALLDDDDLCLPTRLARQCAYLDAHREIVLLGTLAHTLDAGRMGRPKHPGPTTPALIGWLLLVANPLVCSSVMFRAEAGRKLGQMMRSDYTYAEDYDFYHRLIAHGGAARLDEGLTIYRRHDRNMSRRHESQMIEVASRVLASAYRGWLPGDADETARLVATHLAAGKPVPDTATLHRVRACLAEVTNAYIVLNAPSPDDERRIRAEAERMSAGVTLGADRLRPAALSGARALASRVRDRKATQAVGSDALVAGVTYRPAVLEQGNPPTLFVVVDTEAEFDWTKPFARQLNSVSAIRNVELGQAVFDRYGLRPLYVVDYPIATTPESIAAIDRMAQSGRCEIGAHLHPWTTPPYDEDVSNVNSYPGNLGAETEAAKLHHLMDAIEASFGVRTPFYKAGRYGTGPNTPALLQQAGIKVDWSVMPGTDMSRSGGPDFRALEPRPYWLGDTGILTMPMTRSRIGLAPWLGAAADRLPPSRLGRAVLARAHLSDLVTLTPEGVTAAEQIRLIQTLLARGTNQFVLHYHSPSLEPGHTSYTQSAADLEMFVGRLAEVCAYFFEVVGGMAGHPCDLIQGTQSFFAKKDQKTFAPQAADPEEIANS